ncbi:MAG: DNA-directed RNA polymerase subunit beta [Clostridia bacterium]
MSQNIHKVKYGKVERYSFSKIKETLVPPYFISLQKESFANFLEHGIKEVLDDFSPIKDFSGRMELHFLGYSFEGTPKYDVKECKDRDATYALPLKVKIRLVRDNGEISDTEVFMGEFPIMTENGSFIVNGAERVIVSQLVRSPSVYCDKTVDKSGLEKFEATVIPNRGAWLEFKQDASDILWVNVDRNRKITATTLLRALGFGSDEELRHLFNNNRIIENTIKKDTAKNCDQAKKELYNVLRKGEVITEEAVDKLIENLFFDARKYDLARVGRYKFNKKLAIATRIAGNLLAEDIVTQEGEILAKAGDTLTEEQAIAVQNAGVNVVMLESYTGEVVKVIGNNTVDLACFIDCNPRDIGILEKVYYPTLKEIIDKSTDMENLKETIKARKDDLVLNHITLDDIIGTVSYVLGLVAGFGNVDNIDHLSNRRVRAVGELLQNQFRVGMSRLERVIRERMTVIQQGDQKIEPQSLINIKPVTGVIKEFFCSSQLSQFMDHYNPISELTHKRKLSALGPGGLNRERAGFEVRDVHHSHYGRMCPIETPEGQNIGLISSLATFAKVNEYGFIESPYRKVDKATGVVTDVIEYLQADEEDKYVVAQANAPLDASNRFANARVTCRIKEDIREVDSSRVDYMDVSPKQLVSVASALIPFLENDDTSRALMGSNMQRQAVPLIKPEAPIIATGIEYKIAYDSGVMVLAKHDGVVSYISGDKIIVTCEDGKEDVYLLRKFERSNQGTCINQKTIVKHGDVVKTGDILADGPSTDSGELALGRNVLIGFMSWEGYNYEDAVLLSEDLVKDDVYTSIHIEEYEIEARDTKLGEEIITRDIPNLGDDVLRNLDEDGIIRIGAEVHSGDILVGKVSPKGETELTPEERLLRAIFGEKAREVRDTSLRLPHGESGIVVDIKIFTRANKDELSPGVNKLVRVYIAQKRKISVGDKMAGRHGNKGVVSRVLPKEDMPFMADGTPLQIVLNPLGVPSRMNIGQVLEVHLGFICKLLGWKIETPVFDGATELDIQDLFVQNGLPNDGKVELYDGRTGEKFENRVTVGYMYYLKLIHLVDDKMHARSTGPYSLVTQQPLGGKAQFGGQRFGEMEVWALEAYGAANILQEILTVKSDDVVGRVKAYESIVKGTSIAEPGIPESFKVLIKEFQSLALDVKVLTEDKEEIAFKELDGDVGLDINEKEHELNEVSVDFNFEDEALSELTESDTISNVFGLDDTLDSGDDEDIDYNKAIFGDLSNDKE